MADRNKTEPLSDYERHRLIQILQAEVANNFDEHVRSIGDLANLTADKLLPIKKG
ncbi:MAG TPA: hypothetical protein VLU25_11955 [Acidobacteriota bacterium]|nr:hypothetical protein [Acidobacteriota bacterium]